MCYALSQADQQLPTLISATAIMLQFASFTLASLLVL